MAYKKTFNPDALPAHAEPEQAAQALAQFSLNQKPSNTSKLSPPPHQTRPTPPDAHRPQQYGTSNTQTYPHYNQQPQPQPPPPPPQQQQQQQHYNNNNHNNNNQYSSSPPSQTGYNYNHRPPAHQQQQQWAPAQNHSAQNYPPRTPAPPDPDSADLYPLFRAANVSRTGSLTSAELGNALVNADYTPFDPRTINSLMRMFSRSPEGQSGGPTITYNEFQNLWRFLAEWRRLFERFDEDQSGRISLDEFSNALEAFGYRLTISFVSVLYNAYNGSGSERRGSRGPPQGQGMTFDLFVQACISLKHMTDVFKGYDDDRDGYVTLSFEEFLTEMLRMLS